MRVTDLELKTDVADFFDATEILNVNDTEDSAEGTLQWVESYDIISEILDSKPDERYWDMGEQSDPFIVDFDVNTNQIASIGEGMMPVGVEIGNTVLGVIHTLLLIPDGNLWMWQDMEMKNRWANDDIPTDVGVIYLIFILNNGAYNYMWYKTVGAE